MLSSHSSISQLMAPIQEVDVLNNKNSIEEYIKFFSKLANNLACSENIYQQHLHNLQFNDLIMTSDDERKTLYEHVRSNSTETLSEFVDSIIDTKAQQISALLDPISKLNRSIVSNNLPMTDKLAIFGSSLQVVKQLKIYIDRINAILDFMPQAVFSETEQKYPGIENAKIHADKVYELIKTNRRAFETHFSPAKNILVSPKPNKAPVVSDDKREMTESQKAFGRCHV
jgi:hypothetical protein